MKKENGFQGLFRGVVLGHLILLFHVLLLAGVGILVVFFRVIMAYLPLILAAGLILFIAAAFFFYKLVKHHGNRIVDILNTPALSGKSVEIRFLGGFASLNIGSSHSAKELTAERPSVPASLVENNIPASIIELPEVQRNTGKAKDRATTHSHKRKLFKWKN